MKGSARIVLAIAAAALLGGCAVGEELGWHRQHASASEIQLASCDAATATLKGKADHDVAQRACVDAKARQHVD
jgi:hypothetical protein